jgi:tRNA A37 methylthiotransferase MiaB
MANPEKKVYIDSIGCVENALEGQRIAEFFERNDWLVTSEPGEADVLLVNTCGVIGSKERQSVHKAKELARLKKSSARLVVCGCLPDINDEALQQILSCRPERSKESVTDIITPSTMTGFNQIADAKIPIESVASNRIEPQHMRKRLQFIHAGRKTVELCEKCRIPLPPHLKRVFYCFEESDWHYIKICSGCLHDCTFCAIKHAKGKLVSKPMDAIMAEFRAGLVSGQKSIVLAGDDTGAYGRDVGTDLVELLEKLVSRNGDFRIYIRNFEPVWLIRMFDRLKPLFQTGKIRGITVPVQSGSDRILEAMKRGHSIQDFCRCVVNLNQEVKELFVITHVMVGFPGETSEDFRKTLRLISQLRFDGVAPEQYYPRPNIPSLDLPNPLPAWKRRWRLIKTYAHVYWVVYFNKMNWMGLRKPHEFRLPTT